MALSFGISEANASAGNVVTLAVGSGCTSTGQFVNCQTTQTLPSSAGTWAIIFNVTGWANATWGLACPGTSHINSGTGTPSVFELAGGSLGLVESMFLANPGLQPSGTTAQQANLPSLWTASGGGNGLGAGGPTALEFTTVATAGNPVCNMVAHFIIPAGEGGNLSQLDTDLNSFKSANHSDLTSTLAVSCSACAKDSTLSSFLTANHTDLVQLHTDLAQLNTDLTGTVVTSCSACATSANQTSNTATLHTDLLQLNTDLGGTLLVSCSLCSKDSTISSMQSQLHTDLGTLNTDLTSGNSNTTTIHGDIVTLDNDLTAFKSASHSDLSTGPVPVTCSSCSSTATNVSDLTAVTSDSQRLLGWAVGVLLFLSVVGVFWKTFGRSANV